MACLSRLAVASVNTHRTRWPTPTPTQTRSYIHLCTQMYNPPPPLPPPDGVAFLLPPASTLLGLASHSATRTPNFIIIISPAWCTYLPTAESEFCKSRTALAPLTIILKRKFERILVNSAYTAVNYSPTFEARVYFRLCYGPC